MKRLPAKKFLEKAQDGVIIDVRSPSEFSQGHIPGAISLPLFSDQERSEVGTLYKTRGKECAIEAGLEMVALKLLDYYKKVKQMGDSVNIYMYCWRGGMRSQSMAHFFVGLGWDVTTLLHGYKAYRKQVRDDTDTCKIPLIILGGFTGSGKTQILHALRDRGESILDLEDLADHKGSVFGNLDDHEQPTQEQFENNLHKQISSQSSQDWTWVEDESNRIGAMQIPVNFFKHMRLSPVLYLQVPIQCRVDRLVKEYTNISDHTITKAINQIKNRLGGVRTKISIEAIQNKDYSLASQQILDYYDRSYLYGLQKREAKSIKELKFTNFDITEICDCLLTQKKNLTKVHSD